MLVTDLKALGNDLMDWLDGKLLDSQLFSDYPFLATTSFIKKITKKNPKDPLLLQVLPQLSELEAVPGFVSDPVGESSCSPVAGLIHKYPDRVLLLASDTCAINCRFCFRRHLRTPVANWPLVFNYLKQHLEVKEVILSGGDPLMLNDGLLGNVFDELSLIKHLKRLRIHTRLPIVAPELVNPKVLNVGLKAVMVVHCNHPSEIDDEVIKIIRAIRNQGLVIYNQSVLLKGVNDNVEVLVDLSEKLFAAGVFPYYLHLLDKVSGAAHFYVGVSEARVIYDLLKSRLSGYLVPKLVRDYQQGKIYL